MVTTDVNGGEITPANSGRVYRELVPQLVANDSTSGVRYLSFLFQSGQETGATTYQTLALYNANTDDANRNFDIRPSQPTADRTAPNTTSESTAATPAPESRPTRGFT